MPVVVRQALCAMDITRDEGDYLGDCGGDWLMLCEVSREAAINHPKENHGSVVQQRISKL